MAWQSPSAGYPLATARQSRNPPRSCRPSATALPLGRLLPVLGDSREEPWDPALGAPPAPARSSSASKPALQLLIRHGTRYPRLLTALSRVEGHTGISPALSPPPVASWRTWAHEHLGDRGAVLQQMSRRRPPDDPIGGYAPSRFISWVRSELCPAFECADQTMLGVSRSPDHPPAFLTALHALQRAAAQVYHQRGHDGDASLGLHRLAPPLRPAGAARHPDHTTTDVRETTARATMTRGTLQYTIARHPDHTTTDVRETTARATMTRGTPQSPVDRHHASPDHQGARFDDGGEAGEARPRLQSTVTIPWSAGPARTAAVAPPSPRPSLPRHTRARSMTMMSSTISCMATTTP
jgi:hypothetical protein